MDNLNLSFSQMGYFIKVAEYQNITVAAKCLNVTPSTVSKSILTLEQNLNIQLFFRNKNTLNLTEAGCYLYEKWKSILSQVEESLDRACCYKGGDMNSLSIGVLDSHKSEYYLFDYLNRFTEEHPIIRVYIESEPPEMLREKLLNHEFDVIFTVYYDVEISNWSTCKIEDVVKCPLAVCMRKDNPLAELEVWDVKDLKNMNLIVISSFHVPSYGKMLTNLCTAHGFRPNIIYSTSSANSQIYNLHYPNDVFICDRFHRDFNSEKMICRTLRDTRSGVMMVWQPDTANKNLETFLSYFQS